jgi:FkbM family methyltransferase
MPENALERVIKKTFNSLGLEIKKKDKWTAYEWLPSEGIKTVVDVGADIGSSAIFFHKLLPNAKIYSFEPLAHCFGELRNSMRYMVDSQCFNLALGDYNGESVIYHNEYSDSSSLLKIGQIHKDAFPFAEKTKEEKIQVRKLDDIADSLQLEDNILIKIDVQGFENKVIEGGKKTIQRSRCLIVETSLEPCYQGSLFFDDIHSMLKSLGFVYKGSEAFLRNPKNGHLLFCDSVYMH